ncbi:MAG TPA: RNA-binding S4 domain-containing protein [Aestuariivirgaceae bacterium]|jgi:ribosome-associated heat shock protein Hsp15
MPDPAIRLDKFLWYSRIVKTRDLARRMVEEGTVRLNNARVLKPGHDLKPGDVLTFVWSGRVHVWRVNLIPRRRGPPAEARRIYEELAPGN